MAVAPLGNPALQGIQRGLSGMRRAAADVARAVARPQAGAAPTDYARSLVEMQQHATQAKASTRALQAHYDTLGTLLDIHA